MCTCEPVSGLLAREETPPSKQASESAMISRRRRATEQKRYSVRTNIMMAQMAWVWTDTEMKNADPGGARPNRAKSSCTSSGWLLSGIPPKTEGGLLLGHKCNPFEVPRFTGQWIAGSLNQPMKFFDVFYLWVNQDELLLKVIISDIEVKAPKLENSYFRPHATVSLSCWEIRLWRMDG